MGIHQIRTARLKIHEGIAYIRFALAQSLHFRAMKHDPSLHFLQNVVVIGSCPILRDDFFGGVFCVLLASFYRFAILLRHSLILPDDTSNRDIGLDFG